MIAPSIISADNSGLSSYFLGCSIGCQDHSSNLVDFLTHENQACPPAISDGVD